MEDINNYIKENDTDNVILNKLKELGTKLTGQENVQGETVSEVLDFINTNYSGGGSGSKTDLFEHNGNLYKDFDCENGVTKYELEEMFSNGCVIYGNDGSIFIPVSYSLISDEFGTGEDLYSYVICITASLETSELSPVILFTIEHKSNSTGPM